MPAPLFLKKKPDSSLHHESLFHIFDVPNNKKNDKLYNPDWRKVSPCARLDHASSQEEKENHLDHTQHFLECRLHLGQ